MLAPPMPLRAEWRPLADLTGVIEAWGDLTARAAEPNVFYEPAFALNAMPAFGRGVGAILVWDGDGRLLGLFPFRRSRFPLARLTGWTHPYAPLGTPLVDRDALAPVFAAALDYIAADPRLPKLMLMPLMRADGTVMAALDAALAARGGRSCLIDAHVRPLLEPDLPSGVEASLSGARRREFARKRRHLAADGGLTSEVDAAPEAVAPILADFLALEAGGWKSRAGTAVTQHPDVERFVNGAVLGLAAQGKVVAGRLIHKGAPIAAILALRSGDGAWGWKVAYDEKFSRNSPGVLLLLDISERLVADKSVAWTDSCAAPGQPAFGAFWRERLAIADAMIAVTPEAPFGLAVRLENLRRGLKSAASNARDRLRGLTARAK
jgi:CelD/BcsL family acetyltransferase involved in cellulose biosynthesis